MPPPDGADPFGNPLWLVTTIDEFLKREKDSYFSELYAQPVHPASAPANYKVFETCCYLRQLNRPFIQLLVILGF